MITDSAKQKRSSWNKGTKGVMKPNKTSFKKGSSGFTGKHSEETKKKISEHRKGIRACPRTEFKKGMIPWNKGKPLSKEAKDKLSAGYKRMFNKEYKYPFSGKHHSEETKLKLSLANRGKLGPLSNGWKGGRVKLSKLIRNSVKYSNWRNEVFQRDLYTCQLCGKKGCYLEAHHKQMLSIILEKNKLKSIQEAYNCQELWDINNGIALCLDCHSTMDKHRNKLRRRKKQ